MRFHPLSEIFPSVKGKAYRNLARSLRVHGQQEPITEYEGLDLDGRARRLICKQFNIVPITKTFSGSNPVAFLMEQNLARCLPLKASQRAMVCARLSVADPKLTAAHICGLLHISSDLYQQAQRVLADGSSTDIRDAVEGRRTLSDLTAKLRKENPRPRGPRPKVVPLPTTKRPLSPAQEARSNLHRDRAMLWNNLKGAIELLLSMPRASDAIGLISKTPGIRHIVDQKLNPALTWLTEFANEWSHYSESQGGSKQQQPARSEDTLGRSHSDHDGDGRRAAGK